MNRYERCHRLLMRLAPSLPDLRVGQALRSEAGGFMPLHLDVLAREADGRVRIALWHAYRANGDLVPDPDVEIKVDLARQTCVGVALQDSWGYRRVEPKPGLIDAKARDDINRFLEQWLRNCLAQGHALREDA